jgi:hypothetical protein
LPADRKFVRLRESRYLRRAGFNDAQKPEKAKQEAAKSQAGKQDHPGPFVVEIRRNDSTASCPGYPGEAHRNDPNANQPTTITGEKKDE